MYWTCDSLMFLCVYIVVCVVCLNIWYVLMYVCWCVFDAFFFKKKMCALCRCLCRSWNVQCRVWCVCRYLYLIIVGFISVLCLVFGLYVCTGFVYDCYCMYYVIMFYTYMCKFDEMCVVLCRESVVDVM